MANRYWVGGTNSWNGTAGSKWATTSGGAGGAAVPTSTDDVFFDANSGAVTVTTSSSTCQNLTFTGFTGTFTTASVVAIYGHVVLASGMTLTGSAGSWRLRGSSNQNYTSNGKTTTSSIQKDTGAGLMVLQDDFVSSSTILIIIGGFDANNFNMTAGSFYCSGTSTRTLTMGSGTFTLNATSTGSGSNKWDIVTTTNLTFNKGTGKIVFTGTPTGNFNFQGGGLTYYNVEFNHPSATYFITVVNSNTFNDLKVNPNSQIKFTDGTTQTVTTFTATGTSGNEIKLLGTSTAGWTISDSTGTNTVDYCNISYSTATGGATWTATNSTDTVGNTGWNFGGTTDYPVVTSVTSYTLSTQNILLVRAIKIVTSVTSFLYTGIDIIINLAHGWLITASVVNFNLTMGDSIISRMWKLITSVTTYTLTGINSIINPGKTLYAESTAYTLTPKSADIIYHDKDIVISTTVSEYTITTVLTGVVFHQKYIKEPLQTNSFSKEELNTNTFTKVGLSANSYTKEPLANT